MRRALAQERRFLSGTCMHAALDAGAYLDRKTYFLIFSHAVTAEAVNRLQHQYKYVKLTGAKTPYMILE